MTAPLHIVSLADRGVTGKLRRRHLMAFAERLGRPVGFEHICLPPSPVLVSDLLFFGSGAYAPHKEVKTYLAQAHFHHL